MKLLQIAILNSSDFIDPQNADIHIAKGTLKNGNILDVEMHSDVIFYNGKLIKNRLGSLAEFDITKCL